MSTRLNHIAFTLLVVVVMTGAFFAGFGTYVFGQHNVTAAGPRRAFQLFWEAWGYIQSDYYGNVPDEQTMTYAAIRGVLAELHDPYTVLVDPAPHEQETQQLQGRYGGIGATLSRDEAEQLRLNPFPDGPAAAAGVRLDDVLLAIDGAPVTAVDTVVEIEQRLRGEVSTTVTLTLSRPPSAPFPVAIVRAEYTIPSVTARLLREDARLGYIAISHFSALTGQEVHDGVLALRAQGAQMLILDLRDNGGGLLDAAVSVSSEFLDGGVVLYEQTRDNTRFFPVEPGGAATDLPLIVLINGGTASATEIVAGALQDSGRAELVGERTYGKGSVQFVFDLQDGSSLHVTKAVWLTPHRRSIDGSGLAPDVPVVLSKEDRAAGRDTQLLQAIAILSAE